MNRSSISFWRKKHLTLAFLLLFLSSFCISTTYAGENEQKISISVQKESLRNIFLTIKEQTGLTVFYSNELLNDSDRMNVNFTNEDLSTVLNFILKDRPIQFEIRRNKVIVLSKKQDALDKEKEPIIKIQQSEIRGRVLDEKGEGLPGVSVVLKNTQNGAVTDVDGKFVIPIAEVSGHILVISYIGYRKQEITVAGRTDIVVTLEPEDRALSEVVVIGYGSVRKSDLTGAVSSVKGETLQERPAASLNQALAGRMPGVNVSVNSGRPGGRANIRIRGNTSVSVANNPLYVIDGVILNAAELSNGSTPIDYINPNDIESIEVLKDASATAIYGARGANGVILVSTKRGSTGGGRVSYDTDVSLGVLARKLKLLNSEEFLMVEDIAYQNAAKYDPVGWTSGKYKDPKLKRTNPALFDANGKPLYDTDWQKEATQLAVTQNHQVSLTGGNGKESYGVFLGHRNENGLVRESWLKRYSGRFVFDSQLKPWLKVGGTMGYNDQTEKQIDPVGNGGITALRQIVEAIPIIPIKYANGTWGSNEDYPGMEGGGNPLNILQDYRYLLRTQTMLGNLYTNIVFNENLELRTTIGTNIINQRNDSYAGRSLNYISRNQGGIAAIGNARFNSWQFENYLTYKKTIRDIHAVNALLGLSWQHVDQFNAMAQSQNFQDDYFAYNNMGAGATTVAPTSNASAYGLNSYFSRINYSLKDKYLFTITGRLDGSSKFGAANRYAFFPSAALAWRLSDEEVIKNIPAISNLKIRTSIGMTGNSEITAYQASAGMGNYSVIFNGKRAIGIGTERLGNADLRWEKTQQIDAGIELGLFQGRLSMEVDLYRKLTSDMLLNAPVPYSSGFSIVSKNIGSMENKGIELSVNFYPIRTQEFSWNSSFNWSLNKNKVISLTDGSDIFPGPMDMSLIRVGKPVGTFYGYRRLGTWGTDEESEAAKYLKKPGDIKYLDINNDGRINNQDQTIIGKGIPDGFGSFVNTLTYKGFTLTLDLQYMYGNSVFMFDRRPAEMRQGIANSYASVLNAWTPENQNTYIAQFRPVSAGYDAFLDDYIVEDASFIRGRNLLMAYNFSPSLIERLKLNRLRVFVSAQNLFLITKYTGYDPEVSSHNQSFAQGIKLVDYPKPRVFMMGLNIGF